jgi:hypothetical protein
MLGDFTGQNDDKNVIKSDYHTIGQGAWVRQKSGTVTFKNDGSNAETRTVASSLSDFASVFDFIPDDLHFGIRNGINTVDLAPYISKAIEFEIINKRGLKFPAGEYRSSQTFNFTSDNHCRFIGEGAVTLWRNTGAGPVIEVNSGTAIARNNLHIENFIVRGNPASTYGLDCQNVHRSHFSNIRIFDVRFGAVRIRHSVCCQFSDIVCSDNLFQFNVVPDIGLLVTEMVVGNNRSRTTACVFNNIIMEGPIANVGIDLEGCDLGLFNGGTAEAIGRGLVVRPASIGNVFVGTDFEQNGVYDAEIFGKGTTFLSGAASSTGTSGTVLVQDGAERTTFMGGYVRRLDIAANAKATKLIGASVGNGASEGIQGPGTYEASAVTYVNGSLGYAGDFDRGSFLPSIMGSGTAGSQAYSGRAGYWERIGKTIFFAFTLDLTSNGGGSGAARIPLPQIARQQGSWLVQVPFTTNAAIAFSGSNNTAFLRIQSGEAFGTIMECENGGVATPVPIGAIGAGTLTISGNYASGR